MSKRGEYPEALLLSRDWVEVLAFRVAEEPGRIPVDVSCPCGQRMSFRHVYAAPATGRRWQVGEATGRCPSCRRAIRVGVRVEVEASLIQRFESPENDGGDPS